VFSVKEYQLIHITFTSILAVFFYLIFQKVRGLPSPAKKKSMRPPLFVHGLSTHDATSLTRRQGDDYLELAACFFPLHRQTKEQTMKPIWSDDFTITFCWNNFAKGQHMCASKPITGFDAVEDEDEILVLVKARESTYVNIYLEDDPRKRKMLRFRNIDVLYDSWPGDNLQNKETKILYIMSK